MQWHGLYTEAKWSPRFNAMAAASAREWMNVARASDHACIHIVSHGRDARETKNMGGTPKLSTQLFPVRVERACCAWLVSAG